MPVLEFRRILCPVDFSEVSAGALQAAAALASRSGGLLTLLHVDMVPGSSIPEALLATPPDLARDLSDPGDRLLLDWKARAEKLGAPRVEAARSVGTPAEEILLKAKADGSDLIVIGTQGRTGLGHLLLGSVAEEVVRHAACPVLSLGPAAVGALGR